MTLSTLTRPQGANRALIDGDVSSPDAPLEFVNEPVLVKGFRKLGVHPRKMLERNYADV